MYFDQKDPLSLPVSEEASCHAQELPKKKRQAHEGHLQSTTSKKSPTAHKEVNPANNHMS